MVKTLDSPKQVIRKAFETRFINDGEIWMEALKKRNNTVHNYDELIMQETVQFIINEFYPRLKDWFLAFKKESEI